MFGLLAGLVGRAVVGNMAARRGGGLLGGLMQNRRGGGGQSEQSQPTGATNQVAAESPMESKSAQSSAAPPAGTAAVAEAAPQTQPLVNTAPQMLATQARPQGPLAGLMEDAPPTRPAQAPSGDMPAMPRQIVNTTATLAPAARSIVDAFGGRPGLEPSDLPDRIDQQAPAKLARVQTEFPNMNPSRQPNLGAVGDLGHRMAPSSGGFSGGPSFRYMRV